MHSTQTLEKVPDLGFLTLLEEVPVTVTNLGEDIASYARIIEVNPSEEIVANCQRRLQQLRSSLEKVTSKIE